MTYSNMKVFVLLCATVAVVFSIDNEPGCGPKWDVDYLKNANLIKSVVVLDMTNPEDGNETDCFYKYIAKRNVSVVVLDERNMKNSDSIHIKLKYRSKGVAFMVLLPYPDFEIMMRGQNWKIFRWHTRAIVEIVVYKMDSDRQINTVAREFLNKVILEMKLIQVVLIVLAPSRVYFTYDQDSMSHSKGLSCDVLHSDTPFNHSYLNANRHKMRENYPVKIATFYRPPTAMYMYELSEMLNALSKGSNGFGGKDGFLMADIIKYLKLAPVYTTPEGVEPFGVVFENGSVTGVLNDVVDGTADISGNSRFLTAYGIEDEYYFLAYNHFDLLCVIVKKSDFIPLWLQIAQTYSLLIWSLIFIQTTLIAVIRWLHYKQVLQREKSLIELIIETFFSYIVPVTKVLNSSQKILLFGNLLVCIIFVPIIQGNIRSAFTKRKHYPDIDTLEDLDAKFTQIYAPFMDKKLIFGTGNNEMYDRLNTKVITDGFAFEVIVEDVVEKNIAIVSPVMDFNVLASVKLTEIVSRLHIVKECPRLYLYSFIASIDFPWVSDIETTTLRLVDAGLAKWYYEMTLSDLKLQDKLVVNTVDPDSAYVLSLSAMDGPFLLYCLGLLISSLMFVLEYFHPHPLYYTPE